MSYRKIIERLDDDQWVPVDQATYCALLRNYGSMLRHKRHGQLYVKWK